MLAGMRNRWLSCMLASLLASGCVTNTYRIPNGELARLAQTPPEARGEHVRVIQEIGESDAPPAEAVGPETRIILVPDISISTGVRTGGGSRGGGGGKGGIGKVGGGGSDGKGQAIVFLVIAATALVVVAGIEGSRFDGWAKLHPMHPVHLYGHDGSYQVRPLAWVDPPTVAWTDRAFVRETEGPWLQLERAPLSRQGWTYGMYGGTGSLESKFGEKELGPAFTVQLGYFPQQALGVVFSTFFGWRQNRLDATMFESRYTLELQGFPIVAGPLHAGLFGGIGLGYRWEDGITGGNAGTSAFTGGAMLQLDINTRVALAARFGIARAHGEEMNDIQIGLSVY